MSACPDVFTLRAFAEDGEDAALAEHVRGCARCQELVGQARTEEASIRAALPVDVPGDVLERTLAAVKREAAGQEPTRRRRRRRRRRHRARRGRSIWLPITAIAAAGLVLLFAQLRARSFDPGPAPSAPADRDVAGSGTHEPGAPTPEEPPRGATRETEPTTPDAPSETNGPAAPEEPGAETTREIEPTPPDAPSETNEPAAPPSEDRPPEDRPPEDRPPEDRPAPSGTAPALAHIASGKLSAEGSSLALGDALSPGQTLRVGSAPATVRSEGAVTLCFSPRSRFSVSLEEGRRVFHLEKGAVFAQTMGSVPYAIATVDALATPLGTRFGVERKSRTRVRTFEGAVRLAVADTDATVHVRAGFEAVAARGKSPPPAQPSSGTPPRWLPDSIRPPAPPRFEVVRAFEFEAGSEGFHKGSPRRGGARGTVGCLRAVPRGDTYAVFVELEEERGVVRISPDLWIEVTCRSDQATTVVVQLWNAKARENLSLFVQIPARQWVTIAAPLREFTDAAGKPRSIPVPGGDPGTCFNVFAGKPGEAPELLVDDVRFLRERR